MQLTIFSFSILPKAASASCSMSKGSIFASFCRRLRLKVFFTWLKTSSMGLKSGL